MTGGIIILFRCIFLAFVALAAAPGQDAVFLEPLDKIDTRGAGIKEKIPLYRVVDPAKYRGWLDNDAAQRALRLYAQAFHILDERGNPQKQPRHYYIALAPGGNHVSVGFRLRTESGVEEHPRHAYILLAPEEERFRSTLLHETGHVVMAMLAGGRQLDGHDLASIPHSTAALTERATAFSEGWAIHLETLHAHLSADPRVLQRYHRGAVVFGDGPYGAVEYFRAASDLASYAQNLARYRDVSENAFAFEPAWKQPDYLRAQLDKSRDYASLRDANALLQSEGFVASVFFLWLVRGTAPPAEETVTARSDRVLRAMVAMFAEVQESPDTPWLLHWALACMKLFPDEKPALIDALNDLSHGVFVDPQARELWRRHYLAALRLDSKGMDVPGMMAARKRWREQAVADPRVLLSRIAPQLRCEVKAVQVKIEAFGESSPLVFDINTAPEGVLRLIPGMTEEQVAAWRKGQPFASREAFAKAVPNSVCAHEAQSAK